MIHTTLQEKLHNGRGHTIFYNNAAVNHQCNFTLDHSSIREICTKNKVKAVVQHILNGGLVVFCIAEDGQVSNITGRELEFMQHLYNQYEFLYFKSLIEDIKDGVYVDIDHLLEVHDFLSSESLISLLTNLYKSYSKHNN